MSLPLDDQTCLDCQFFIGDGSRIAGECHRNPPRIMRRPDREQSYNIGIWPEVTVDNWCGEFEQRPGDDGE